jgi:nucleotide-sensitive chloride channel 1A
LSTTSRRGWTQSALPRLATAIHTADTLTRNLILFQNTPKATGVSIPYPAIALHGITKKHGVEALLINLSLNDAETVNADEDIDALEIIVLPPSQNTEAPQTSCIQEIFSAMNTCADLHPDPDDEEGEPDLTAPGATGWITADNMDEYMDDNGNFVGTVIGGEELGPGAGTVRPREGDEEQQEATNGVNGHEEKYQRTGWIWVRRFGAW